MIPVRSNHSVSKPIQKLITCIHIPRACCCYQIRERSKCQPFKLHTHSYPLHLHKHNHIFHYCSALPSINFPIMADEQQTNLPLLQHLTSHPNDQDSADILTRMWVESKKLWLIVGPSIFSRISTYSILVISQAFAGHLGDLDLAAISIALNVIIGFDFGLMVPNSIHSPFLISLF